MGDGEPDLLEKSLAASSVTKKYKNKHTVPKSHILPKKSQNLTFEGSISFLDENVTYNIGLDGQYFGGKEKPHTNGSYGNRYFL